MIPVIIPIFIPPPNNRRRDERAAEHRKMADDLMAARCACCGTTQPKDPPPGWWLSHMRLYCPMCSMLPGNPGATAEAEVRYWDWWCSLSGDEQERWNRHPRWSRWRLKRRRAREERRAIWLPR